MPLITPFLDRAYPLAVRGEGSYIYDAEGTAYLDGCSGAVTAAIGHGVDEIVEAMTEQAARICFSYRGQFSNPPAEMLAEELRSQAPGDLDWVFFVNSGSEAMETAQKIAVQYWRERLMPTKTIVLGRSLGYHGITLGALSMSGHVVRRRLFAPLLHGFPVVAPPYCYRCPLGRSYPSCGIACADDLEEKVTSIGAHSIAGFAVEPVIGAAGGAIPPPPEYFPRIKEICERHHILLIADEVMTGCGRTGYAHALDHWHVQADLVALGKGLTAGYTPLAATLVSDAVVQTIRDGSGAIMSGHTFSGNPLSCAVALAVCRYMTEHKLVERSRSMEAVLAHRLGELEERHPAVGNVRGMGMLWGAELIADRLTRTPFPSSCQATARLVQAAQDRGLLLYPALAGADSRPGDAVIIAPPLNISETDLDRLIAILDDALYDVEEQLQSDIWTVHGAETAGCESGR